MDEMAEQFDIGREIAEIMVAPVGFIDDDDDVRCTNMSHIA